MPRTAGETIAARIRRTWPPDVIKSSSSDGPLQTTKDSRMGQPVAMVGEGRANHHAAVASGVAGGWWVIQEPGGR